MDGASPKLKTSISLSTLPHTWIFDLDGTLVSHNGHLNGGDTLLPGVKEFFLKIPDEDTIIILTARKKKFQKETENFLLLNNIKFDVIIFEMPHGERILINDVKPSGLCTAYSINQPRDNGFHNLDFTFDKNL